MTGLLIQNNDTVRVNGKLVTIEGKDYYIQRMRNAIRLQRNEIKYSSAIGIDWFQVFDSDVSEQRIIVELRRVLLRDPETRSIQSIEVIEIDRERRSLLINFKLISEYGSIDFSEVIE